MLGIFVKKHTSHLQKDNSSFQLLISCHSFSHLLTDFLLWWKIYFCGTVFKSNCDILGLENTTDFKVMFDPGGHTLSPKYLHSQAVCNLNCGLVIHGLGDDKVLFHILQDDTLLRLYDKTTCDV